MSQEQMKELFTRTKEFVKDKDIKVITPRHIRFNHPVRQTTRNETGLVFIDYLSILGN